MVNRELVKKALSVATPAQLIRARALVGKLRNKNGWEGLKGEIDEALIAFDEGRYDDVKVARFLSDEELGEALR